MKRNPTILVLACLLAIALPACGSSPEVSAPTATAVAALIQQRATDIARGMRSTEIADSAQATATASARLLTISKAAGWPISFSDPFDNNDTGWSVGVEDDPLALIEWAITDGLFLWQAECREGFIWWQSYDEKEYTDFYLAAEMQQTAGPASGDVGLIFRLTPDDQYFLFTIQNDGQFSVFQSTGDGWLALIDWTASDAILPGERNQLAVVARESHFDFLINQTWVADMEYGALPVGKIGLAIGLDNAGDVGSFQFDNLEVRSLNPVP